MNTSSRSQLTPQPRGLSIMEVMLAVFILSICSLSILTASYTSSTSVQQSAEYAAAVSAARKKMEEIQGYTFAKLNQRYGPGSRETTFKVYFNEGTEQSTKDAFGKVSRGIEMLGFRKVVNGVDKYDAGEVVLINNESALSTTYGYSCSRSTTDPKPDNGLPGGINFGGIPMDLNGDGNTTSGAVSNSNATRMPVGVIVRWDGQHGPERYELWTVISRY
ncbi:MAG: hypothetical protein WCT04_12840 [Planctomycetota bacterium]